jgi:hypothetical protein
MNPKGYESILTKVGRHSEAMAMETRAANISIRAKSSGGTVQ